MRTALVDESHRGHTFDREMTEGEQELHSFDDHVSTCGRVLGVIVPQALLYEIERVRQIVARVRATARATTYKWSP